MHNTFKKFLSLSTLLIVLSVITTGSLKAQQYPIYSQYIFDGLILNPAYAGSHVQVSATAMYRNQWVNFKGAPKTLFFSMHTSLLKERIGVGLLVDDDRIGSYSNQNVYGSYAFIIKTPAGKLAMGLQAGINIVSADFSKLNLVDANDPSFANLNKVRPNFGAGVYFHNKLFYAGFSVPFLLNSAFADKGNIEDAINQLRSARYYYLHGGIKFPLNFRKTLQLEPSILVRAQEGAPLSADINATMIFYDKISFGVSYRNIDAVVSYIDVKLGESLHFSYSYDWTTSDISKFSNGTHEFMVNYRFKMKKAHKALECPDLYSL